MVKPKVTFSILSMIKVIIQGKNNKAKGLPRTYEDGGLIQRFLDFYGSEGMEPIGEPTIGGGEYIGYFDVADYSKVKAWLQAQDARQKS